MKRRKLVAAAILAVLVVVCLVIGVNAVTGRNRKDTITFVREDTVPADTQRADYKVDLGRSVGGAEIIGELWQDGVCTESVPVVLNSQTKKLEILLTVDGFGANEGERGMNVQIDTGEEAGSLLTYVALPDEVCGYSFTAYEDQEVLKVQAGEEKVLAAMAFDLGPGVKSLSCDVLSEQPERVEDAPCLFVVRARFTAEPIPAQESASE